jgi:IS4 transposase
MNKGTFFTGQPIFSQVLNCVPGKLVKQVSTEQKADYYCKRFSTHDHLITMLYCIFNHCTALREVTTGLLAWEQRISHLGLKYHPRRSTLSDANKRRSEVVFEQIYLKLLSRYGHFLSDSRIKNKAKQLFIFDSTTITLFQEVLQGAGQSRMDGRRKGGIKVHTLMRSDQDVPCMIRYSAAAACDTKFLKTVQLPEGSLIVFDRGYPDYRTYNRFTEQKISWITRLRSHLAYQVTKDRSMHHRQVEQGIEADKEIILGHEHEKTAVKVRARLITYKDPASGKIFYFLTNNLRLAPLTVANYYRKRWQIELLFKRIKQNYPLKYFLGDSENAIKIQIWCVLIADLLIKVIKKGNACNWSYSNVASMIRLHLMTYMDLKLFLKCPEKIFMKRVKQIAHSPSLFPT